MPAPTKRDPKGRDPKGRDPKARSYKARPARRQAELPDFVAARCRPAADDFEWTSELTLWAHYRRWAHLADKRPHEGRSRLVAHLKRKGLSPRQVGAHVLWPLYLVDVEEERAAFVDRDREQSRVVKGRVVVTKSMIFYDGPQQIELSPGTVLSWMHPSRAERRDKRTLYERQVNNGSQSPVTWVVVVWRDKRRLVPADHLRKLAA